MPEIRRKEGISGRSGGERGGRGSADLGEKQRAIGGWLKSARQAGRSAAEIRRWCNGAGQVARRRWCNGAGRRDGALRRSQAARTGSSGGDCCDKLRDREKDTGDEEEAASDIGNAVTQARRVRGCGAVVMVERAVVMAEGVAAVREKGDAAF